MEQDTCSSSDSADVASNYFLAKTPQLWFTQLEVHFLQNKNIREGSTRYHTVTATLDVTYTANLCFDGWLSQQQRYEKLQTTLSTSISDEMSRSQANHGLCAKNAVVHGLPDQAMLTLSASGSGSTGGHLRQTPRQFQ